MNIEDETAKAYKERVSGMLDALKESLMNATDISISVSNDIAELVPEPGDTAVRRAFSGHHVATIKWFAPPVPPKPAP